MCARFTLVTPIDELIAELLADGFAEWDAGEGAAASELAPAGFAPRYNVAPTNRMPVVTAAATGAGSLTPTLRLMRWGLVPRWAKDVRVGSRMINARSETVGRKPAFAEAFRARRCLVPANGFFEWKSTPEGKFPHYFRLRGHRPFCFAGVWSRRLAPRSARRAEAHRARETSLPFRDTFAVLTTRPNALVGALHDRMPVILDPRGDAHAAWLDPQSSLDALKRLFAPFPDARMERYAVSPRVGSPRNDDRALLDPYSPPRQRGLFGESL